MKWNTELYSNKHAFVYEYGESLIKLLAVKPDDRILDLGCGTGHLTKLISELTNHVVGMDYSSDMIFSAKKNFLRLRFSKKMLLISILIDHSMRFFQTLLYTGF